MIERWLNEHWVAAALCTGSVLTLLLPALAQQSNAAWLLTYSLLPVYMFHQVEEHTGDRFRNFVNEKIFGGIEALSHAAVLWINLPGVWGVGLLSIYAAADMGIGWGLSMVYLVLVNALAHVAGAAVWREYNPGLWSAAGLFLPVGMLALLETSRQPGVRHLHHAVGLGAAIAIHVVIVAYTKLRAARLSAAS
jgi:hypothetical protein